MLRIDKTEYDLNLLFSFEVLKEILLKLARTQDKIEKDLKNMKNSNSKRDKEILKIEKILGEKLGISDFKDKNDDNNELGGNESEEGDENEFQNNYNENDDNKENNNEKNKNIQKGYDKSNEYGSKDHNNQYNRDENDNNTSSGQDSKDKKITLGKDGNISPEILSKMLDRLNNDHDRIYLLETKLNSDSKNLEDLETKLKNHNLDNESEFKLLKDKINELFAKDKNNEKKFEDLTVKVSDFDIFSMFKDNGDGTIDATKIMVKALEEKVFKKFDLIDKRYKIDSLDNLKTKSNVENILPKLDQFKRELERINEMGKQYQEDLEKFKKEIEEAKNEAKNNFYKEIQKKLDELQEELEKKMNDKLSLIENRLKDLKSSGDNNTNFDLLKLGLGNNDINQETIDALEKKINDLRKKLNDLENTFKFYMSKNETDSIRNELKDIKLALEQKITNNDLKELYNFHLNTKDEINDIKDQEAQTYDQLSKTMKDLKYLQQKVESLVGNIALLQNNPQTGNAPLIDFSKFIDQQKLTETLRPILKEIEKVYKEIDSFRRDISLVEEEGKNNLKKAVNKLEEEINNKYNEIKNLLKKFIDKNEFNKSIKSLEIEIKGIIDENKKEAADSWLLAKQPLKCFNCATCEANIKNDYSPADYLPWKKYPRGEKIHRIGQGFSHMLQMMTSEFIKSLERNDYPQELDLNIRNSAVNNNANVQTTDKSINGLNINNKEMLKEDLARNLKKLSKMNLPKVKQYSNSRAKTKNFNESMPISDEEQNYMESINNNENESKLNPNSPRILKIRRKEKSTLGKTNIKDIYNTLFAMKVNQTIKNNIDPGRSNIFLKTEKNNFEGFGNNIPKN